MQRCAHTRTHKHTHTHTHTHTLSLSLSLSLSLVARTLTSCTAARHRYVVDSTEWTPVDQGSTALPAASPSRTATLPPHMAVHTPDAVSSSLPASPQRGIASLRGGMDGQRHTRPQQSAMALNLMSLGAETETHVDGSSTDAGTASAALQAPAALAPPLTAATAAIGEEGRPRALTAPALHRRAELEGSVHPGSTHSTRAADEVPATTDSEGHAVDGSSTAQLRGGESRDKKRVSCNRASVASSVYGFGDDDFDGVQMRQHGRTNDRSSRGE